MSNYGAGTYSVIPEPPKSAQSRVAAVYHLELARTTHLTTDKDRNVELARIWAQVYEADVRLETTLV